MKWKYITDFFKKSSEAAQKINEKPISDFRKKYNKDSLEEVKAMSKYPLSREENWNK